MHCSPRGVDTNLQVGLSSGVDRQCLVATVEVFIGCLHLLLDERCVAL